MDMLSAYSVGVNLALGTAILATELSVYGIICPRTLILHLMVLLSSH